jgi:hypothetical protein
MSDDPAHDAIAAAIRAMTGLVTSPPNSSVLISQICGAPRSIKAAPCSGRVRRRDQTAPAVPSMQPLPI